MAPGGRRRKEEEGGEYTGAGCREDTGPHCRQNRRREERQTAVRGPLRGRRCRKLRFPFASARTFSYLCTQIQDTYGNQRQIRPLQHQRDRPGPQHRLLRPGARSARNRPPEGRGRSFELVFLGDGESNFHLELTWLRDKEGAYELGDNESHLCIRVAGDYDAVREFHRANGWVCFENHEMGLYFINDPDDYWIEVLPLKR